MRGKFRLNPYTCQHREFVGKLPSTFPTLQFDLDQKAIEANHISLKVALLSRI